MREEPDPAPIVVGAHDVCHESSWALARDVPGNLHEPGQWSQVEQDCHQSDAQTVFSVHKFTHVSGMHADISQEDVRVCEGKLGQQIGVYVAKMRREGVMHWGVNLRHGHVEPYIRNGRRVVRPIHGFLEGVSHRFRPILQLTNLAP